MQTKNITTKKTSAQSPVVSPHQDSQRIREAQGLLKQLSSLLLEGESSNIELLNDTLKKAEEFSIEASRQSHLDEQTSKALEDIAVLLGSARQLARNKDLDERLKKIMEASQKVAKSIRTDVTGATKQASQPVLDFIEIWRPLFYQMMSSRDFRVLLLDIVRITKDVVYSHGDPVLDRVTDRFVEGVPAKDIAKTTKTEVKERGAPEMSDEEWERIQYDLQRVMILLSREPSYHQGVERLFQLLDIFQRSLINPPDVTPKDPHVDTLVTETENLVAAFSGKSTFENWKSHLRNLINTVQRDENLHQYLLELKQFLLKTRSEEEIRSEEFVPKSKELSHRGRELFNRYRYDDDTLRPFLDSSRDMIDNIKNDELTRVLREHAGIVQSDLSYVDSQGNLQVDTDMLSKLQTALLPYLAETLKYIPVPRVEYQDRDREFWLDNIVLCSYDLLPENIRFHLESDSEISVRDIELKGSRTQLVIRLDHLLTELKDVEFFYRMKTFPSLEERGRVTFRIKGDGARLTLNYTLEQGPQDSAPRITKGYASFNISELEIEFDKSTLKHDVLVPLLTPLFNLRIRNQIESQVENNLGGFIDKLGGVMSDTLSQYNRPITAGLEMAKKTIKTSPMGQIYEKRREALE